MFQGRARGNWDPREDQLSTQLKRGQGPHYHVEAAVHWCSAPRIAWPFGWHRVATDRTLFKCLVIFCNFTVLKSQVMPLFQEQP